MKKLKVLALLGGNGTSLYPFLNSRGFEILGNIECRSVFYTPKQEQWKLNFGEIPMVKDIDDLWSVKPDIIVSHPDCGHSSIMTYNKMKKYGNPRTNESMNMFFDGILHYKPKMWIMENLEGLLKAIPREEFEDIFKDYNLTFHVGSVQDFGNHQLCRKRLVVVGVKKGYDININVFRVGTPKKNPELNSDIANLQEKLEIDHFREPLSKEVCIWWDDKKVTLGKARKIWRNELKGKYTWPGHYKSHIQPAVYRQVKDAFPRTVRKGDRQFNWLGRHLSSREMARIQGLPDDFRLYYDANKQVYWCNKTKATVAKCPPMEIFVWFKKVIEKNYSKL